MLPENLTIAALGAGRMGRGVAHVFAYAGIPVTLVDAKPREAAAFEQLAAEARADIERNLGFLAELDLLTTEQVGRVLALISIVDAAAAPAALAAADVIIEGVPETRDAKREALGLAAEAAHEQAIITSTTSTMLVTELSQFVTRPERFLNTHFLNPAFLLPLVELSASPGTDPAVTDAIASLFERVGKVPVRCAASPGYIIPRLQSLIMAEAARMVDEGVASAADIDKAIRYGFGPRYATLGVLEFIDWGGVDILYYAGHYLARALDSPRHAPPPEVDRMMEEGRLGMNHGQGYYDYRDIDVAAYQRDKLRKFVRLLEELGQVPRPGV